MSQETPILVSIVCLTYNHENYIRKCLEGFVSQKTNFRFEAIIHEDASTDGTAAIVREFAEKYPDIIKPIFQEINQWRTNIRGIFRPFVFPAAKGKYLAFCDGDDYWTDPTKLQQQVDALEANPSCFICVHDVALFDESANPPALTGARIPWSTLQFKEGIIPHEKAVYEILNACCFHFSSFIMRRELISIWGEDHYPALRKASKLGTDAFFLQLALLEGDFFYLARTMSVYRRFVPNSSMAITRRRKNYEALNILTRCNCARACETYLPPEDAPIVQKAIENSLSQFAFLCHTVHHPEWITDAVKEEFARYEINRKKIYSMIRHQYSPKRWVRLLKYFFPGAFWALSPIRFKIRHPS